MSNLNIPRKSVAVNIALTLAIGPHANAEAPQFLGSERVVSGVQCTPSAVVGVDRAYGVVRSSKLTWSTTARSHLAEASEVGPSHPSARNPPRQTSHFMR